MGFAWRRMPVWFREFAEAGLLPGWLIGLSLLAAGIRSSLFGPPTGQYRKGQNPREQRLRKYFATLPSVRVPRTIFWISVSPAILTLILPSMRNGGCFAVLLAPIAALMFPIALISGLVWLKRHHALADRMSSSASVPLPSDAEVQGWLEESFAGFPAKARDALGLVGSQIGEPLVIMVPNVDPVGVGGVDYEDFRSRKGADGVWRFGVYNVLVIWPTDVELAGYACDYNFIRDVALNVETKEFHYRDVVAISTGEESSSHTLPTAVKMTHAEEFRISVASGEAISVVVDSEVLRVATGGDELPDTGVRKAVAAIRAMLREKKV